MILTPPSLSPSDFSPLHPALILSFGAIVLLLSEVFTTSASSRSYQAVLTVVTAALAGFVALGTTLEPSHPVMLGFGVQDAFSSFLTFILCVGLALTAMLAAGFLKARGAERGEFYGLMCFAVAGMSLLALSSELITLFVSLELLSVATYALAAYLRRGPRPAEAGFKYFILGAFSSALLIYGTALLYGVTGSTKLSEMAGPLALAFSGKGAALAYAGLGLVAAGLAFKVAAVPFHMWTPDVYEGAPTPVTALMSAGVKAAAFAALVRVFVTLSGSMVGKEALVSLFSVLAFLTMVGGNLLALPQRNVKRMLAYSSIAHAGYLLLGVAALFVQQGRSQEGLHLFHSSVLGVVGSSEATQQASALRSILFYLLAYTVTVVGAFGTLGAIERREDEEGGFAWDLDRFSGLVQRRPGWAVAMAIFMLSLGGIPPTVGFMGKFLIFRSAVDSGLVGLTLVGVLTSAAGIYYYLRVVVYMFMRPAAEGTLAPERRWGTELVLGLTTAAVVVLGLLPNALGTWLGHAGGLFR